MYTWGLVVLLLAAAAAATHSTDGADVCSVLTAEGGNTVTGPTAGNRSAWMAAMKACRSQALAKIHYNASFFDTPRLQWTQSGFQLPMVQGFDRFLWNGTHYTVDKYLDDVNSRYGGVDAILLWPTYENIGLDDRDQLALFQAMPGGYTALRQLHADFHARGVQVIWGYNPWDTGTKDQ